MVGVVLVWLRWEVRQSREVIACVAWKGELGLQNGRGNEVGACKREGNDAIAGIGGYR